MNHPYEIRRVFDASDGEGVESYGLSEQDPHGRPCICFGVYTRDDEGLLRWIDDHDTLADAEAALVALNGDATKKVS